jgi:plastocyanin
MVAKALWTLPVVLIAVAATATRWEAAGDGQAVVHQVVISVSEDGQFSYSLDPVRAARGDQIEWSCDSGNWSVHFIGQTPLAQQAVRGTSSSSRRLPVRANAADGSYKYFVAVAVGDEVYTDDPEVIVGPRG